MNEGNLTEENNKSEEMNASIKRDTKSKKTIFIIISVVVVILSISAFFCYKNFHKDLNASEVLVKDRVVAVVNGVSINESKLEISLKQVITQMETQGKTITKGSEDEKQLRAQVLENVINDEILFQNAKKLGFGATIEEINKEMQTAISQIGGEEKFKTQLKNENMKEGDFRDVVSKQIAIQKYVLANVDINSISATDKEISEFYNQISANQENVPPLEEIHQQVKNEIIINKQRKIISDFIRSLRNFANVSISL